MEKHLEKMRKMGWEVVEYGDDWGDTLEINTGTDGSISYTVYLEDKKFTLVRNEFRNANTGQMEMFEIYGGEYDNLSSVIWKISEFDRKDK